MARDSARDRFDSLAPRDVVATLLSLDRRFRPIVAGAADPELGDVIERPGPDGTSLAGMLTEAAQGASVLSQSLETSLRAVDPVVAAAALDPTERVFSDERTWSINAAVDTITAEADASAARIDDATTDDMSRTVGVTGGGSTTSLGIAQQLARELIGALTASERQLDWLRGQV